MSSFLQKNTLENLNKISEIINSESSTDIESYSNDGSDATSSIKETQNKVIKNKDYYENIIFNYLLSKRSKDDYTHVAFGKLTGKFNLTTDETREFLKLYIKAIKHGCVLNILERPMDYAPLIIDIDLKVKNLKKNLNKRLYDKDLILLIIDAFRNALKKIY
jgi:hypothetical protein